MVRSRFDMYVALSFAFSALVACASALRPQGTTQGASGAVSREPESDDATRGMRMEDASDAVVGAPFLLDATLHVRRVENGISVSRGEVRDGGTVMSGDRIQLRVRTTRDAYLYLAYCSQQTTNPRYPGLTLFPAQGSISVKANETTIAPNRAAEIVLDDKPGPESLYLILSRVELSIADPRIADAIAAARRGTVMGDCSDPLHIANKSPSKVTRKAKKAVGQASVFISSGGPGSDAPSPSTVLVVSTDTGEPLLDPTRAGEMVWMNGSFGAASPVAPGLMVLRYGFQHIAMPRP